MTKKSLKENYLEADKYVVVNVDPDLRPIILSLPSPPPIHTIDGYGLPMKEQRFKRLEIPLRLKNLEREAVQNVNEDAKKNKNREVTLLKIQHEFWKLLNDRSKELKKEINFIRRVWWNRLNGMWFFNRGKPTYITGRHFYYLNFFSMDTENGYADYRDCDRREYVFMEYCWTATETFARIDSDGWAIKEEDGSYKMIDLKRRVCLGSGQSKNRRRGNTSKALSDGLEIVTRTFGTSGLGIQSYTEENARSHFKEKIVPAWDGLPIWLRPFSKSGRGSNVLKFDVDQNDYFNKGLGTQISYATTSSPKAFDGKKFTVLLTDEEGKELSSGSVAKRWEVNKHTLAQGDGMVVKGFSYHPSTADQQSAGAFDYYYLIQSSNFYRRIPVKGQTISGLFRIFIPAQDGLEGFIDSYGYSVTGEIKDYQREEGFTTTAEEYLRGERDLLLKDGSPEAMQKYREHKKLYPMQFSDSWLGTAGSIGFDIEKIDARLAELRKEDNTVRGNLEWVGGVWGGEVEFRPDPENGRFQIAEMPLESVSNKKTQGLHYSTFEGKDIMMYEPLYKGTYVLGADPFRFSNKQESKHGAALGSSSKLSDGGIAIFMLYDESVDGDKPRSERVTDKFVLSYRHRGANSEEYSEDVLKCAVFYGAHVYPEQNITSVYEYFIKMKYGGYLLYDVDKWTGDYKKKPGVDSLERSKQELFSLLRDYIDHRCHVEPFADFLQECKDITGIEMMRNYDRLAAHGIALMGSKSVTLDDMRKNISPNYNIEDYIELWDV